MRKLQAWGGAAALLAALLLGGCARQDTATATPEQAATPTPEVTAESTPEPAVGLSTNPLTGLDDADYTGKRPVAVMLRTLDGAQPQWGIASADVLIEGVTEGNTAGLMALFADVDRIGKVGPVGPGRDLFLQAALPLNAMPVSIDKNVYAANLLNTLAYQDLDGYHVGKTAFAFDQGRQDAGYREENCWYTTGELIRNGAASYGTALEGSNTPLFRFGTREEVAPENRSGMSLTVTFSKSDSEQLNYNTGTGLYEKLNADGSPMTDADNGQQAAFTNVFVLYASSGIKDDGYTRQYDMTGGTQWTWKFGSSSPSVRDYVLVPTDDDSAYRIICRMDGGGISDVRTGYLVQTTCEDGGRRMISDVTELSDADMTQSELFRLYYSTGLALPSLPDEVGNFSGLPRTDSLTAAQDAFYYFGNPVDGSKASWIADVTQIQSIVRSDIRGGAYIDIVQLTFTDGSDPINVQMEKTGSGYWKPTGIQEDVSAMSGANVLPVSADAFGAISFAHLPTLNTGDIIIFNFGSKPVGGVHLVNHLVDAAGRIRYQNMTDDETTLTRTNSGYVYTIPQSVSELLASDLSVPFYHALTLEYTDAQHIRHTAVAAYMTNAMTQLENPPLPSGGYYSDALGCTLKLPQEFRNAVSANINTDGTMTFFVKDTDSVLMTLTVQPISVLRRDFGENWAKNYPVPVRPLAEWDGLAYFLIYPSDVQYDPADEQAAAQYQTLFEAAQSISAEDLALDADPHDTSAYADRATAVLLGYLDAGIVDSETETALFDELDHRAQADGVSFSAAMRQAGENAQALWHKHLADES